MPEPKGAWRPEPEALLWIDRGGGARDYCGDLRCTCGAIPDPGRCTFESVEADDRPVEWTCPKCQARYRVRLAVERFKPIPEPPRTLVRPWMGPQLLVARVYRQEAEGEKRFWFRATAPMLAAGPLKGLMAVFSAIFQTWRQFQHEIGSDTRLEITVGPETGLKEETHGTSGSDREGDGGRAGSGSPPAPGGRDDGATPGG